MSHRPQDSACHGQRCGVAPAPGKRRPALLRFDGSGMNQLGQGWIRLVERLQECDAGSLTYRPDNAAGQPHTGDQLDLDGITRVQPECAAEAHAARRKVRYLGTLKMAAAMNKGIDCYGRARRSPALDARWSWAHLSITLRSDKDLSWLAPHTVQTGKRKQSCRPKLKDLML